MEETALGVDVGGTHISCAAFNLRDKKVLKGTLVKNNLNSHGTAEEILKVWAETMSSSMNKIQSEKISGIGIAMPGPFDYQEGVALFTGSKYKNLFGINIAEALKKMIGTPASFPIRFINDATAFAIGEDLIGKASGTKRSLSITMGTGLGSAFIRNHLPVVKGKDVPVAGALYHLPFEDSIADTYFSTKGLLLRYKEKTGHHLSGVKELTECAETDPIARDLFADLGYKLGIFLNPLIKKFQPEVFIIGGNISNASVFFMDHLHHYVSKNGITIKIEISELKETASMIGAATLIEDNYYEQIKPMLGPMSLHVKNNLIGIKIKKLANKGLSDYAALFKKPK